MTRVLAFLLALALLCAASPAAAQIALVGSNESSSSNNDTCSVNLPGGVAQDDVCYAFIGTNHTSNSNLAASTWTELADLYCNDTTDVNFAAFRKVQGASPDASVSITGGSFANSSNLCSVICLSGVDTTTPEDATTTTAQVLNTPVVNPPSITTVTNDAWVFATGGSSEADVPTAPTNYGNLVESGGTSIRLMMATRTITSAGAEDPGTFGGIAGTTADCYDAASIAVRPAAAAGGDAPPGIGSLLQLGVGR